MLSMGFCGHFRFYNSKRLLQTLSYRTPKNTPAKVNFEELKTNV